MSVIQSAAAFPKGRIVRWIAPAAVYPSCSTAPGWQRPRLCARRINHPQVRHRVELTTSVQTIPPKPPKWNHIPVIPTKTPKWKDDQSGLIFSQDNVPPLEVWGHLLEALEVEDLTPQACHDAATQYCAIAVGSSSVWKGRLEKYHGIDNFTLYCTGVLLCHSNSKQYIPLGWHMLNTASDLGFDPSTVTMMSLMSQLTSPGPEGEKQRKSITQRFQRILKAGSDPDALTVQGRILYGSSKLQEALAFFDRANRAAALKERSTTADPNTATEKSASTNRAPRWPRESECYQDRAEVLIKLGRVGEAKAAAEVAAFELDNPKAYHLLAQLMAEGSQEQKDYLLKAAVSGIEESYPLLAEFEAKKAEALDPKDPRRDYHRIMANEWDQLAQPNYLLPTSS